MSGVSQADRQRSDGRAVFAAATLLLVTGLIATLARVGAPDGLVEALGPLFMFLGLAVIGVGARAPSQTEFLAARRGAPPLYGGLAFAATATGIAFSLGDGSEHGAPWRGFVAGVALAAFVVAPSLRRHNASAISDRLATRFPALPSRIAFTGVIAAAALLTALAGFATATRALVASANFSARAAEALVALTLALTLIPGGLKGLLWSDAASGGGALLIVTLGALLAISGSPDPLPPLALAVSATLAARSGDSASLATELAAALAIAGSFTLAWPALGARSPIEARRAGLIGVLFCVFGFAAAALALPFAAAGAQASPVARALAAAATWLPGLALARSGLLAAARAAGLDLRIAYAKLIVLSSRRIARIRLTLVAGIAATVYVAHIEPEASRAAVYGALAIGLAFIAPGLALTLWRRAASGAASFALACAIVVAIARLYPFAAFPKGPALLAEALLAGVAALTGGLAFAALFPTPEKSNADGRADPFSDLPLD